MRARFAVSITIGVVLGAAAIAAPSPVGAAGRTTVRVSVGPHGQADGDSYRASISADGRFVAFSSNAANLVGGDTNALSDVFVRDRAAHKTFRVSIGANGQANGSSYDASISPDGRYVAFASDADNLVSGDTNSQPDIFVRDRASHTTSRVSVGTAGQGDGPSYNPSISAGGRFVAFESSADNLSKGDSNGVFDVFVRDRGLHRTGRVSVSTGHVQGDSDSLSASISGDGRYVAFGSYAATLVSGDTNGYEDVFVRDRTLDTTSRVSTGPLGQSDGESEYPSISSGGRYVTFESTADNLVSGDTNAVADVFVRDRTAHKTFRSSITTTGDQGNNHSMLPDISSDGRFVAFYSLADNLCSGDTNHARDVLIRDRELHRTLCVSQNTSGVPGNHDSFVPSISSDGRFVTFESFSTDLVSNDTNGYEDVFVRGPYG